MQALPAGGRQSPERHSALLLSSPANQEAGGRRPQAPEAPALLASEELGRARMGSAKGSRRVWREQTGVLCILATAVRFNSCLAPQQGEADALMVSEESPRGLASPKDLDLEERKVTGKLCCDDCCSA